MPGVIARLDPELINQIAAGEVVERPASAIKELIENSLDAEASRIEIAIEGGGIGSLSVTDDGVGMIAQDARLALERHATSKLRSFDDLSHLGSFGFRGEALPSLASVSRFSLITRARGERQGTQITVGPGHQVDASPIGAAEGTTVLARELFFNVPARRKFLKSVATESAHVADVVRSAALSRPEITFVLRRDGKVAREYLRAASREERARHLAQGEPLMAATFERGSLKVQAFLGPPERARAGANHLDILVNGRPVRDLRLARAVAQAYGGMLDSGRYPYGVVYLDLPSQEVDVNVHPQKSEVRFVDARAIYQAMRFALESEIGRAFQGQAARPAIASFSSFEPGAKGAASWPSAGGKRRPEPSPAPLTLAEPREHPLRELDLGQAPLQESGPSDDEPSLFRSVKFYAKLRYLSQLRASYLLCEGDDGLYIIDQHAAAERLTFHRLREAYRARGLASQRLITAETLSLDATEIDALLTHTTKLTELGVEIHVLGTNTVACAALPQLLAQHDPATLVRELACELAQHGESVFSSRVDRVLATMACHGSLRAGDTVHRQEAEALLGALDEVDFSLHCPHGRPVLMRLGIEEIERRVHR